MLLQIKEDEAISAQCVIQDITCILTSTRLIVVTPAEVECYPLEEIAAIGVYDDNEKYSADLKQEKKKRVLLAISCCVLFNALLSILCIQRNIPELIILFFSLSLSIAIPPTFLMPTSVIKESVLKLVFKQAKVKQYSLKNIDTNAHLVKTFAEKVFAQVSNPSKKAFALN